MVVWLYLSCIPCVCLVISNIYFFSFHISALIASSVSVVLFYEVRQVWLWQTYQVMCVPACNPANLLSWQFWSLEGLYCKYWSVMLFSFGHILNYKYKLMKKQLLCQNLITILLYVILQACALYDNWWPMLTGEFLVLGVSIGLLSRGSLISIACNFKF